MAETLDRKNKEAEQLNPNKSGIRAGNPQLETPSKPRSGQVSPDKPHAPPGSGGRHGQDPTRGR
jgi:hypothetical protein